MDTEGICEVVNDSVGQGDLLRAANQAEQQAADCHATLAPVDVAPQELASSSWQCASARDEVAMLRAQECGVLLHQAENYRDWEEWEIMQALEPAPSRSRTRRQCVLRVEAALAKGTGTYGPRMTRSWHFEIPEEGALHLNMQCHMEPVVDQDEVETQLVLDTKRWRTELADQAARCDSNANFAQFA